MSYLSHESSSSASLSIPAPMPNVRKQANKLLKQVNNNYQDNYQAVVVKNLAGQCKDRSVSKSYQQQEQYQEQGLDQQFQIQQKQSCYEQHPQGTPTPQQSQQSNISLELKQQLCESKKVQYKKQQKQNTQKVEEKQILQQSKLYNKQQSRQQILQKCEKNIKKDPFLFINKNTTRQQLFQMIYLLQQQNQRLKNQFQLNKQYIMQKNSSLDTDTTNIQNMYKLVNVSNQIKTTSLKYIQQHNQKQIAQQNLLTFYKNKQAQLLSTLHKKAAQKQHLLYQKVQLQKQYIAYSQQVKQYNDKLVMLKGQRDRLMDQVKKIKTNTGGSGNGNNSSNQLIDKLMHEYYETINRVMMDDFDTSRKINNYRAGRNQQQLLQKQKNIMKEEQKLNVYIDNKLSKSRKSEQNQSSQYQRDLQISKQQNQQKILGKQLNQLKQQSKIKNKISINAQSLIFDN